MGMDDLLTGKHSELPTSQYRRTKGPRFEERHVRVTTYLDKSLHKELMSLRERGELVNLTEFYNKAVGNQLALMRRAVNEIGNTHNSSLEKSTAARPIGKGPVIRKVYPTGGDCSHLEL